MNYLIVDDEPLALADLEAVLKESLAYLGQSSVVQCFTSPKKALEYACEHKVEVSFLDIELGSTNGLILAKQLKDIQPGMHIIFVTSHSKYAVDAFQIHATGYLMKPALKEDILRELTFLYGSNVAKKRVRVQTFGGFDVFVGGKALQFKRSKSKELLAYLVDRRGVSVTNGNACGVLWEEAADSPSQKSYFRTIVTDLRGALRAACAEDILVKGYNSLAIVPELLDCDSYRFLEGDPLAINSYRHDYLPEYSWAEFTVGEMEKLFLA